MAFQNREIPSASARCGVVAVSEPDPDDDDDELGDRAAIIQYGGRYPRPEAERRARAEAASRRDKSSLQ